MTSPAFSHLSSDRGPLAVVTGAASGIGLALTTALLDRGVEVVAIDLETAGIDARARRHALDVRDAAGMADLAARYAHRPASHVFANAGVGGVPGDLLELSDEAWQWAWEVNFLGALRTLRLWWPQLCAGRGKAVATVSSAALQSLPGAGSYRASKAALLAALEGLYYQARGTGVSVHALCPGMVRSNVGESQRYPEARAARPVQAGAAARNPFVDFVAQAMPHAEPGSAFAQRVLQGLDDGAPFYWLTHPETLGWVHGRHRTIEAGEGPFSDFGVPA